MTDEVSGFSSYGAASVGSLGYVPFDAAVHQETLEASYPTRRESSATQKRGNVHINVTLRCVHVTIVAMEKQ